ncbi:MAG: lysoplasmalogenase [Desulfarculus sp.]|nr:lysoplasmalogenase [Desulfarculus sp.]
MFAAPLLVAAALLLGGLLWAEAQEKPRPALACKSVLSGLFVLAAWLSPHPLPSYYHLVLAGLVLGLLGDVCLALPGQGAFRAGLLAFLAGHVLYVLAFAGLVAWGRWLGPHLAIPALAALAVFMWLRRRAGSLLLPVCAYILVISLMLAGAWAVWRQGGLPAAGGWAIFLGALSFYLSDLLVARDRFVNSQFVNRLLGLPLYYAGQFALAFSVGWVA